MQISLTIFPQRLTSYFLVPVHKQLPVSIAHTAFLEPNFIPAWLASFCFLYTVYSPFYCVTHPAFNPTSIRHVTFKSRCLLCFPPFAVCLNYHSILFRRCRCSLVYFSWECIRDLPIFHDFPPFDSTTLTLNCLALFCWHPPWLWRRIWAIFYSLKQRITTHLSHAISYPQPTYDRLMDSSEHIGFICCIDGSIVALTDPLSHWRIRRPVYGSIQPHDNNLNLNFVSCGLQILCWILGRLIRLLAALDSWDPSTRQWIRQLENGFVIM